MESNSFSLDDTDGVGYIEGVVVLGEADICLLKSIRADQCVHFVHLDLVDGLHRILDLSLIGTAIHDENKGIVLFDLFHRRLGGERVPESK